MIQNSNESYESYDYDDKLILYNIIYIYIIYVVLCC